MFKKDTGKNGRIGKRKYTVAQVREALMKTGTQSGAAKLLKADRVTIGLYVAEYPELKDAVYEAKQALLDLAETGLIKNVRNGHPNSIFFTLKTLGKDRGFVERVESTGADGAPLVDLTTAKQTLMDKFKTQK